MKGPVIVIVGRPNVGKSTLFNRIIMSREAIVHDKPGVTRDRKYAETLWNGRWITLVDTGGYIPQTSDALEEAIKRQIERAIAEAHCILFLVDVSTGITPQDEEVAEVLRRSDKRVLLVVNKVDDETREHQLSEFYGLGFGEPFPISALNGRHIGDLLDKVVEDFPSLSKEEIPEEDSAIKLAVIGKPNVGKSCFINALLGEEKLIVTEIPGTTRDSIDTRFRYHDRDYLLIDTAGLRRKTKIKDGVEYYSTVRTLRSIERSDVALVFIDALSGLTQQDIRVLREALDKKKGVVLVVNKWDLVEKDTQAAKAFEREIRAKLKTIDFLPILFISAKTGKRIYETIDVARSVYEERNKRIRTHLLNKVLGDIIRRNQPEGSGRRSVKIYYCTQIKSSPPMFAFFSNEPAAIKANYKRFLEKKIRENFGFFGVPITLVFRKK